MQRFFSARTLASANPAAESVRTVLLATNPVGYAGCCAAIRDMDHRPLLGRIQAPTLVIGGDQDLSTPWAGHGDVLADGIPGARAVQLARDASLQRGAALVLHRRALRFPAAGAAGGPACRRASRCGAPCSATRTWTASIAAATEFTRDFQEMITRYAWGTVWTRPGLDPRVRRLLVLAMTASLGRWEEFRLHVRTGLAGELEMVDLKEVLLQVAIYAGVPAANTGFHAAADEAGEAGDRDAAQAIAISALARLGEDVRTIGNHRDRGARRQRGRERGDGGLHGRIRLAPQSRVVFGRQPRDVPVQALPRGDHRQFLQLPLIDGYRSAFDALQKLGVGHSRRAAFARTPARPRLPCRPRPAESIRPASRCATPPSRP